MKIENQTYFRKTFKDFKKNNDITEVKFLHKVVYNDIPTVIGNIFETNKGMLYQQLSWDNMSLKSKQEVKDGYFNFILFTKKEAVKNFYKKHKISK
jgi:hypothetical protein